MRKIIWRPGCQDIRDLIAGTYVKSLKVPLPLYIKAYNAKKKNPSPQPFNLPNFLDAGKLAQPDKFGLISYKWTKVTPNLIFSCVWRSINKTGWSGINFLAHPTINQCIGGLLGTQGSGCQATEP